MYDGGTGDLSPHAILENNGVVLLYFSALLLLIIMIVWFLRNMSSSEHYYGYGMPNTYQVLASGPDVRFQELSGTNQGNTPINMATVKQTYPGLFKRQKGERLTARPEPPVFYDISQTLGEYQYASQYNCADGTSPMPVKDAFGNMTYACQDGSVPSSAGTTGLDMTSLTGSSEYATSSPATAVQEALLQRQLG